MALFAWLFAVTPAADSIQNHYALGLLYTLRGPLDPPTGAVIVALDNQAIGWLRESAAAPDEHPWLACMPEPERRELAQVRGPSSLPRSVHACLLDRLGELGFEAVAFDILFAVPGEVEDDRRLAEALRKHRAALLVGVARSTVRDGPSELLVERQVQPMELFRQSAAATGTFLVPRSGGPIYGYLRTAPGFEDTPSLPDATLGLLESETSRAEKPVLEYFWLYGPPGSVLTVSARDVLNGEASDAVRDVAPRSVALVGASDPNASDYPDSLPSFFRSGIGADISGVELVATALVNARNEELLHKLRPVSAWTVMLLFAFALGFLAHARSGLAMLAIPVASVAYVATAAVAFSWFRLLPPLATPVFVVAPMAFIVSVFVRYRFARALILRLAPAPAARRMLQRTTDRRGAAVEHDATVAFFDLIGSTALAEKVEPAAFNALLNAYFDMVAEVVGAHRGQITAFAGDGITALFADGGHDRDHAARACAAVAAIVAAMRGANAENAKAGLPALHMRVGLNSGRVAEGDIGARDRFNFSVVGDVVNLAARLEQMGKTLFPGENDVVLVGERTEAMAAAAGGFEFTDCGLCEIRGRERRERVYRLGVG